MSCAAFDVCWSKEADLISSFLPFSFHSRTKASGSSSTNGQRRIRRPLRGCSLSIRGDKQHGGGRARGTGRVPRYENSRRARLQHLVATVLLQSTLITTHGGGPAVGLPLSFTTRRDEKRRKMDQESPKDGKESGRGARGKGDDSACSVQRPASGI